MIRETKSPATRQGIAERLRSAARILRDLIGEHGRACECHLCSDLRLVVAIVEAQRPRTSAGLKR